MKTAVAAYPLSYLSNFTAYAEKIATWVAGAAGQGAELLVFPEYGAMELSSLGGRAVSNDIEAALFEVASHQAAVDALHCDLARHYSLHILGASGPAFLGARPVNRATFYGPHGIIGHQDKQVMTRFERETWHISAGQGLTLFETPLGRIGILICYDSEFPLLARALIEAGAEILLVPSCTDTQAGFSRVRVGSMARALENQCVVVHSPLVGKCDFCPAVDENTGSASVYGPPDIGFPPNGIIAEGQLDQPGWVYADISREAIALVRHDGRVLNHAHWPEQIGRVSSPVMHVNALKSG